MQGITTDSVLLAAFAAKKLDQKRRTVCDLFCGCGLLSLLLARRCPNLSLTGIDIDPVCCQMFLQNAGTNDLSLRMTAQQADASNAEMLRKFGTFDAVVANPPYFSTAQGAVSPDVHRRRERHGCSIAAFVQAAALLLKNGGTLFCVYPTSRLAELICTLHGHGLEPKHMQLIAHTAQSEPTLALIEAAKGAAVGMRCDPTMILYETSGEMTADCAAAYHLP
jgi:tRNA1Val (adenine37-N6)-methyltransferase